jgi:DNA polymerase III subunit epsilon
MSRVDGARDTALKSIPLSEVTFVVLDLETSGSSPASGAAITEIGAVKVRGGIVLAEFESFVNPQHLLSEFITNLTGITDQMLTSAPTIEYVLPELLEFLGDASDTVLVAHNAPFDLGFLKASAVTHSISWPSYSVIDTARIARSALERDEVRDCKLSTLARFFGATTTPNHRALDDAKATVDVLHGILERLGSFGVRELRELQEFKRKRARAPLD